MEALMNDCIRGEILSRSAFPMPFLSIHRTDRVRVCSTYIYFKIIQNCSEGVREFLFVEFNK